MVRPEKLFTQIYSTSISGFERTEDLDRMGFEPTTFAGIFLKN